MKKVIFSITILFYISLILAEKMKDTTIKIESNEILDVTTNKNEAETETTPKIQSTTKDNVIEIFENESESGESLESVNQSSLPPDSFKPNSPSHKRKVLYVNQQQYGKLNVQLELNDVNLVVIPNKRDPQLSLLNLLLSSAQKSSLVSNEEESTKEKNAKVTANNDGDYSKYNYIQKSTNELSIESRAPYRVDISSTLNSQPVVEITYPSEESQKASLLKVVKPTVYQSPQNHRARRFVENNFVEKDNDVVEIDTIPIDSEDNEIINTIEDNDNYNEEESENPSEFVLLGATENCGPGRRRNSYQICVPITE